MPTIAELTAANAKRWSAMHLTRPAEFDVAAKGLVANKLRYLSVGLRAAVPWFIIAVIHQEEASGNFAGGIANGQPWNAPTTNVPKGRGPFPSWEAEAFDALTNCAPFAAKWKDWSAGGALTLLEQYNGLGYAERGLPSPYIWSGTDQYVKGKYVADGVYDPNVVDKQLGCAGLIVAMAKIDGSVAFAAKLNVSAQVSVPAASNANSSTPKASIWAAIFAAIRAIFK